MKDTRFAEAILDRAFLSATSLTAFTNGRSYLGRIIILQAGSLSFQRNARRHGERFRFEEFENGCVSDWLRVDGKKKSEAFA